MKKGGGESAPFLLFRMSTLRALAERRAVAAGRAISRGTATGRRAHAAGLDAGGGDVGDADTGFIDPDHAVAGLAVAEGVADGAGGEEADALDGGVVFLVRVAGEDDVDAVFLEEVHVAPALFHVEVGIVLALVHGLPDDGAVDEDEGVLAILRGGKLFLEPDPLLVLGILHAVLDAVGVHADERAAALPEGEAVIPALGDEPGLFLTGETHDVVVARNGVHGRLELGDAHAVDGILHGVVRRVDQVAGHDDEGGGEGIDLVHGRLEQRIRLRISRRPVEEPDLRVAHLNESERLERAVLHAQHQGDGEEKLGHKAIIMRLLQR